MKSLLVIGCFFLASPAFCQTPRYTNADLGQSLSSVRVTPAEAAAILAPHQFTWQPTATQPRVLVLPSSATSGPFGEFREFSPARRLDGTLLSDPQWEATTYLPFYRGWRGGQIGGGHHSSAPHSGSQGRPR
jgi:hypothetical protein